MTTAEMKAYFLSEYDAATSLSAPGFEDSDISSFLNIAQDNIVTELYKNKEYTKLSELFCTTSNLPLFSHPNIANGYYLIALNLSSDGLVDFFYYIDSRTKITRTNPTITNEWVPNDFITRDVANKLFKTALNKVWFKYPKSFFEMVDNGDTVRLMLVVIVDSYTTGTYGEVTYIKRPIRINITTSTKSELNESLHQGIVTLAVQEAVKSIKAAKISNQ